MVPNAKSVNSKKRAGMAFLHGEEGNHNTTDERKENGAEDRYSLEPQKYW